MRQPEPSTFAGWLRRKALLLALWRDTTYRRNVISLTVLDLKRLLTWRFVVAMLFFPTLCWWLSWKFANTPQQAYELLQIVMGAVALALGSRLFSADQEQGTFELLWLATGSEKALLRRRLRSVLFAFGLLAAASAAATAAGTESIPFASFLFKATFLLITTAFFIFAFMALLSTFLPQAWTAGLLGLALLGAWYAAQRGSTALLFPFFNPYAVAGPNMQAPSFVPNRIAIVGIGMVFLSITATRLRRLYGK